MVEVEQSGESGDAYKIQGGEIVLSRSGKLYLQGFSGLG